MPRMLATPLRRASPPGVLRTALRPALWAALVVAQLEAGLRLTAYFDDLRLDRSLTRMGARKPPPRGARVDLADVVQLSADRKIVYELIPNLSVRYQRGLTTNSAGFRSPEIAVEKPRGTVRVLGLGDSVMFGWYVHDDEPFLSVLGRMLRERHPEVRWEEINTAVPGYNSVMEVEVLIAKGLRYQPDLVVLNFVGNDVDLPNFIRNRAQPLDIERSFLVDRVRAWTHGKPTGNRAQLVPAPDRGGRFESDPARVPPEYRDMVGPEAATRALTELRDLSAARGFALVVVGHPVLHPQVRRLAKELGIATVESQDTIVRYAREHGIVDPFDPRLVLSPTDPHPTALGHRLIAEAIFDHLERTQVAGAIAERAASGGGTQALSAAAAGDKVSDP